MPCESSAWWPRAFTPRIRARAGAANGIEMPLFESIHHILHEGLPVAEALDYLMDCRPDTMCRAG